MSTGTVNSREIFSLYDVSPVRRVLSEDEALPTNVFSILKEDEQIFLGWFFKEISGGFKKEF